MPVFVDESPVKQGPVELWSDTRPLVIDAERVEAVGDVWIFRTAGGRLVKKLPVSEIRSVGSTPAPVPLPLRTEDTMQQPGMTTAKSYGESAVELETLRLLVEERCPDVRFGGFTASSAANGEYSFRLPNGLDVWVSAPTAPRGGHRHRHPGCWLFRLTIGSTKWEHARSVDDVVDWVIAQADRPVER